MGFVDFLIFLFTSQESFDERYNQDYLRQKQEQQELAFAKANEPRNILAEKRSKYLEQGKQAYKNYEFSKAIAALEKAVETRYDDPETHFLLARIYALSEQAEPALEHLNVAVAFDLEQVERIRTEGDLAYLRIQPAYRTFEKNDFQLVQKLPIPKEDSLPLEDSHSLDLLEQLSKLEKLDRAESSPDVMFQQMEKQLKSRNEDE